MSQETYTFACPVCAVRLSVPKALAGVRGPCPQCHHEITAPQPESVLVPALAGSGGAAVPPLPNPPATVGPPPLPTGPVIPPPSPPTAVAVPPARATAAPVAPARSAAPPGMPAPPPEPPPGASAASEAPAPESREMPPGRAVPAPAREPGDSAPPPRPAPVAALPVAPPFESPAVVPTPAEPPLAETPPLRPTPETVEDAGIAETGAPAASAPGHPAPRTRPRRSPLAWVAAVLLLIGLLAAAALNFLPRQSLRQWLGRVLPGQAVAAVVGPETDGPTAPETGTNPPIPAAAPSGVESAEAPTIQIRPALDPPEGLSSPGADPAAVPPADPVVPAPGTSGDLAALATTDPSGVPPAAADGSPGAAGPGQPDAAAAGGAETPPSAPAKPAPAAATTPVPPAPAAQDSGVPPSLLPDISPEAPAVPAAIDESLAGAQEALTLFLQARNWQDRLALCEGGDSLREEMAAYYSKTKDGPNAPTSVEHIASAPLPDGTRTVQVFHVTFPDLPQGFPVPVRQTEEGWKIDWRAFVEFREGRLKKFLAGYQDAPEVFRVRLQRSHQTDRAVPNADKKYAFRIAAPIDGHEGYVYVDKDDSIVGPKIAKKLDANTIHLVMAKLKWVRGTNGRAHVELRDIVSESWREAP